uniref:Sperm-associated antigen 16 protein n=1 Tax=Seriola dumerili TaxID=41447 RepID=A0A3B4TCL9_SERDU
MSATNKNREEEDARAPSDCDDDFKYEEVYLEDDGSLTEGEEDLEATVKAIQNRAEASAQAAPGPNATRSTHQPKAVDDFLRNFLIQTGMTETLDCFQTEWTEMVQKGLVDAERVGVVPDVYTDNQRLESELKNAQREREEYRRAASTAAETLVRVQKARDLHRLQHKRVVQEKNRLIEEMKKLKVQCNSYEPAVKRMNEKYQAVLKQTVLVTLERDKAVKQVNRQSAQHNTAGEQQETRDKSQVSKGQPLQ